MASGDLNLIKLAVGVEDVAHLQTLQQARAQANLEAGLGAYPRHLTRMRPRRASELLDGGCMYWVIKGAIRARQHIVALDDVVDDEGVKRCAIVLDPELHATRPRPHRAFQGWRYLQKTKAPEDAGGNEGAGDLPDDLMRDLDDLGLL